MNILEKKGGFGRATQTEIQEAIAEAVSIIAEHLGERAAGAATDHLARHAWKGLQEVASVALTYPLEPLRRAKKLDRGPIWNPG